MNNNTTLNSKSQELNFTKWPKITVPLKELTKREAQLFFCLKPMCDKLERVFPSQTTLARMLGLGENRWAISETAEALEKAGYIRIERVGVRRIKHFYSINPKFYNAKGNKMLASFRLCATFALSFLMSTAAQNNLQTEQITLLKGKYYNASTFSHCSSFQVFLKTQQQAPQRYRFSAIGETYSPFAGDQPPDDYKECRSLPQHLTLGEWDEIFASIEKTSLEAKEFEYMQAFTEEQLIELTVYPKEVLQHANKRLSQELLAGTSIGNHFAYFKHPCC